MLVERTTIDGRETVRLVRDQVANHETAGYVIRGNDRVYTLGFESDSIPSRLPRGWLDTVPASFRVIQPAPFPTPTPPPAIAPLDAAHELGQRLSRAFAARDVDALGGLITPQCSLGTVPAVAPGVGVGGSTRAVVPFLAALRESFARSGVAVVVDPNVQVDVQGTGIFRSEQFFVRAEHMYIRGRVSATVTSPARAGRPPTGSGIRRPSTLARRLSAPLRATKYPSAITREKRRQRVRTETIRAARPARPESAPWQWSRSASLP